MLENNDFRSLVTANGGRVILYDLPFRFAMISLTVCKKCPFLPALLSLRILKNKLFLDNPL